VTVGAHTHVLYLECTACGASGIFKDTKDADGVGVVCRDCKGSGRRAIDGVLFTERKTIPDIELVYASKASFVPELNKRKAKDAVTYTEFLNGKLPPGSIS